MSCSRAIYTPPLFTGSRCSLWPQVDSSLPSPAIYQTFHPEFKWEKKKSKLGSFILNLREWGENPTFSLQIPLPKIDVPEIHTSAFLILFKFLWKIPTLSRALPKASFLPWYSSGPQSLSPYLAFIFFIALISDIRYGHWFVSLHCKTKPGVE